MEKDWLDEFDGDVPVYSERELLEMLGSLLKELVREERINSIEELHGFLRHIGRSLRSPAPDAPNLVELESIIRDYMGIAPAFRIKRVGGEGSRARLEREFHIALEDRARALIDESRPRSSGGGWIKQGGRGTPVGYVNLSTGLGRLTPPSPQENRE